MVMLLALGPARLGDRAGRGDWEAKRRLIAPLTLARGATRVLIATYRQPAHAVEQPMQGLCATRKSVEIAL